MGGKLRSSGFGVLCFLEGLGLYKFAAFTEAGAEAIFNGGAVWFITGRCLKLLL